MDFTGPNTMNWEAIGAIGEVVGAVAVVVTLVYLAIQVREGSRATRANSAQLFANGVNTFNLMTANSVEQSRIARMVFDDPESFTPDERFCADSMIAAVCRVLEGALMQNELGALHPQTLEVVEETIRKLFATQAYQQWWEDKADFYPFSRIFTSFIENECGVSKKPAN